MAKHPAAFINALSESRDFSLAIHHLQKTWDDYCDMREENAKLRYQLNQGTVTRPHPASEK